MGGISLSEYKHPVRCDYLLGSEDNGLSDSIIRYCHDLVSLSAVRTASYNVAVAGSLIMFDRFNKAN
jgi:tRNA G18 (ribose-2'-O)-methylase SpoU